MKLVESATVPSGFLDLPDEEQLELGLGYQLDIERWAPVLACSETVVVNVAGHLIFEEKIVKASEGGEIAAHLLTNGLDVELRDGRQLILKKLDVEASGPNVYVSMVFYLGEAE